MSGLVPNIDPDGLLEYSVVYTDRAVNHMSESFQSVMKDISTSLCTVYNADAIAVVPGSGTFGMEAVARQFASDEHVLVIRNGWFSYRWTQIFEVGNIPTSHTVCMAQQVSSQHQSPFTPSPLEDVVHYIKKEQPKVVFAPHVETSAGMLLPEEYLTTIAEATHEVGGIFVLDCIASGAIWVDMKKCGVDVLISAPQKGWSGTPCCALVMMNQRAVDLLQTTTSSSFSCDLKKWRDIMSAYEQGGHAYHATMPTDSLRNFRDVMNETRSLGFSEMENAQRELGKQVRDLLQTHGYPSVAAVGYEAPGVVVSYTTDPDMKNGSKFIQQGLQIAGGVPLQCGEPDDFSTFRIGLFGLDKLTNVDRTVGLLAEAVKAIG
jgi:aspartate aminotransferase-like enzyme